MNSSRPLPNDIKEIHKDFTLCGKPRNSLFAIPDDLFSYVLCFLRDEPPSFPKASVEQWMGLIDILNHNRIVPFLFSRVGVLPEPLRPPKCIVDIMRVHFLASRVRNMVMDLQLSRILSAFKQEQVRALVMKGPAIAWSAYPDPAMRPYDDLDLLVLPEQFLKARGIMESLGYRCEARIFETLKNVQFEEQFVCQDRPAKSLLVEMHWDLHRFYGAKRNMELEDLFHHATTVNASTLRFDTFNPVDAILHIVSHTGLSHTKDIRLVATVEILIKSG